MGNGDLWRIFNQKVGMVVFAVHLSKASLEVLTDIGENGAESPDSVAVEDVSTIFGHKDQVNVHIEYTVSAGTNIAVYSAMDQ